MRLNDFELRSMPALLNQLAETERRLAFQAQTREAAEVWQESLRSAVLRLLGPMPETCDLTPQMVESTVADGLRRDLIIMQTQAGVFMPCYVLTPLHVDAPYKTVIALHGHGTWGVRSIVGIAESEAENRFIRQFNMDYARQLATQGFRVFAPMLRGFGERMEDAPDEVQAKLNGEDFWQASCQTLSVNALLCGQTLLGWRVWDVMRLVEYIRSEAVPHIRGLGCVGFSGGGMLGLYAMALMPALTCGYISGCLNTFRDSLLTIRHCPCNYVPHMATMADMSDIAGLIAPRPLLIEAGRHDPIFPLAGVETALQNLGQIYQVFSAETHLANDIFDGAHQWGGQQAGAWFNRWLI